MFRLNFCVSKTGNMYDQAGTNLHMHSNKFGFNYDDYMFQIFRDTRAAVLEQSLRKLGVERLSKDDVQKMQWEVLEAKIGNWIHYMRISVRMNINLLFSLFYFCSTNLSKFA